MSKANVRLAEELRVLGLLEMAALAENGHYGDFTSPLAAPKMALVDALWTAAEMEAKRADHKAAILVLRKRVMNGDFDG